MPSLRYSLFASDPTLTNGRTAIDLFCFFFGGTDIVIVLLLALSVSVARNAKARSRADWNRSDGLFSRQRIARRASSCGTELPDDDSDGGSSRRIAARIWAVAAGR